MDSIPEFEGRRGGHQRRDQLGIEVGKSGLCDRFKLGYREARRTPDALSEEKVADPMDRLLDAGRLASSAFLRLLSGRWSGEIVLARSRQIFDRRF